MNINNLFQYGSLVNVLIRNKIEQEIGGSTFLENEPFTLLNEIEVAFSYTKLTTEAAAQKQRLINYNNEIPTAITLNNVPLTTKICNLIFDKKTTNSYKTIYGNLTADDNNKIYLTSAGCNNVFVYSNNTLIYFNASVTENYIQDNAFVENIEYLVFYEELNSSNGYLLTTPDYPYFSIELFGEGNKDNETNDFFIKIDNVSLDPNKQMNFDMGTQMVNLTFKIIDTQDNQDFILLL